MWAQSENFLPDLLQNLPLFVGVQQTRPIYRWVGAHTRRFAFDGVYRAGMRSNCIRVNLA